jgi:hypothetical protein
MGLELTAAMESGNACDVAVRAEGPAPEVAFAIEPRQDLESLWFRFRIVETQPEAAAPAATLRLLLKHTDTLPGLGRASALLPVWRTGDKAWTRLLPGREETLPDGQRGVSWEVEYPKPAIEVAMCYPYGPGDLHPLVGKSRGYWLDTAIGVTASGRRLVRLYNAPGGPGQRTPGLYLLARQQAGETPGSWVLDGLLQQISSMRKSPFLVWAVPFVNLDGILAGDQGRDTAPWPIERSWTSPARRHEVQVIQRDMARWKERCQPRLALEFRAALSCDADGLRVALPDPAAYPEHHKLAARWAATAGEMLGPGLAAAEFVRGSEPAPGRWPGGETFGGHAAAALGVPAVTVEVPYTLAGGSVLTLKRYREAGRILADALLRRL